MTRLGTLPWPLSFSYGRAMQQAALKLWSQDLVGNFAKAQAVVYERAKENGLAALGKWEGESSAPRVIPTPASCRRFSFPAPESERPPRGGRCFLRFWADFSRRSPASPGGSAAPRRTRAAPPRRTPPPRRCPRSAR